MIGRETALALFSAARCDTRRNSAVRCRERSFAANSNSPPDLIPVAGNANDRLPSRQIQARPFDFRGDISAHWSYDAMTLTEHLVGLVCAHAHILAKISVPIVRRPASKRRGTVPSQTDPLSGSASPLRNATRLLQTTIAHGCKYRRGSASARRASESRQSIITNGLARC